MERSFGGVSGAASPEATLALLLVGTGARRAAARADIEALVERADFERLARRLSVQGLLGLAGSRLEAIAGERLPESFRAAVSRKVQATRRRGAVQAALTLHWTARLEDAGIACLPLKGPLLGERVHGDLGYRSSGDVDLLVERARLWQAEALLHEEGFAPPPDRLSADGLPEWHLTLDDPQGKLPRIELHWRIHWYEQRFSADLLRTQRAAGHGRSRRPPRGRARGAAAVLRAGWVPRAAPALRSGRLVGRVRAAAGAVRAAADR